MLYTRKGDSGTTTTFGCNQSISKSSAVAEALGALDETNSFLGIVRAESKNEYFELGNKKIFYSELILSVQQDLFIIQAEVARSPKAITSEKIKHVEEVVDGIEKLLPPITTFFLSGATQRGAQFDFARTLARRAERRVVAVQEEGKQMVSAETLQYLNRLSSLLYALARIASHTESVEEIAPSYE